MADPRLFTLSPSCKETFDRLIDQEREARIERDNFIINEALGPDYVSPDGNAWETQKSALESLADAYLLDQNSKRKLLDWLALFQAISMQLKDIITPKQQTFLDKQEYKIYLIANEKFPVKESNEKFSNRL